MIWCEVCQKPATFRIRGLPDALRIERHYCREHTPVQVLVKAQAGRSSSTVALDWYELPIEAEPAPTPPDAGPPSGPSRSDR